MMHLLALKGVISGLLFLLPWRIMTQFQPHSLPLYCISPVTNINMPYLHLSCTKPRHFSHHILRHFYYATISSSLSSRHSHTLPHPTHLPLSTPSTTILIPAPPSTIPLKIFPFIIFIFSLVIPHFYFPFLFCL